MVYSRPRQRCAIARRRRLALWAWHASRSSADGYFSRNFCSTANFVDFAYVLHYWDWNHRLFELAHVHHGYDDELAGCPWACELRNRATCNRAHEDNDWSGKPEKQDGISSLWDGGTSYLKFVTISLGRSSSPEFWNLFNNIIRSP